MLRIELRIAAAGWLRGEEFNVLGPGGGSVLDILPMSLASSRRVGRRRTPGQWVEGVPPRLGTSGFRAVLLDLPTENPLTRQAARPLVRRGATARRPRRYADASNAVEASLGATKSDPVSAKEAITAGLPTTITDFVARVWQALAKSPTRHTIQSIKNLRTRQPMRAQSG
jgi:hypothetical protein